MRRELATGSFYHHKITGTRSHMLAERHTDVTTWSASLRAEIGRFSPVQIATYAASTPQLSGDKHQPLSATIVADGRLRLANVRLFLLGGTGAIGRYALPALVAAGHDVSALARTPHKAAAVREHGGVPVTVPMFDRRALSIAFRGHDAVVNLSTSMPSTATFLFRRAWAETERVRLQGSAAVVDAALAAGVGMLVQESVSMLYPGGGDRWIDESVPPDRYPNAEGNLAAEASAARLSRAGGTAVVLRLGLFYGPGARHSEQFLALARRHVLPVLGNPDSYVSSIHLADGGAAVPFALQVPGGVYNVVDNEPLTKRQYAQALADAAERQPWIRGPGRLAAVFGDRMTSLTRSLRVSNRHFRRTSGWEPRYPSAREGWAATAREG
jgi:nucleoside-diphosphate-sugar epimerase